MLAPDEYVDDEERNGLIAVFYDRKNKREVKNTELCFINAVVDVARVSDEDPKHIRSSHELQIGELGYKSKDGNLNSNWDLYCMYSDLIFLGFEDK